MRLAPLISILALNALAACAGQPIAMTEPATESTEVRATTSASGVRVSNATDRTIYYTVFEKDLATRASLAPCTDPVRCPSVAPAREVTVPYSAIAGYTKGAREAVVYWWHLVPGADGRYSVDRLRSYIVKL